MDTCRTIEDLPESLRTPRAIETPRTINEGFRLQKAPLRILSFENLSCWTRLRIFPSLSVGPLEILTDDAPE